MTTSPASPRLCHVRFATLAASMPDAPAIIDRQQVVTYAELDERSDRVASWLQSRGVGSGALVAMLVDRSADLAACALGVWKAGAAYLALSPGTPRLRLRAIAGQLSPAALLTQSALRARGAALGVPTLVVDEPFAAPQVQPQPGRQEPASLAYVIHTSGSTGTAKGVAISHASLTAVTDVYQRMYGLGAEVGRVLQLSDPGFDVATGDLARTILTGACLVTCPADVLVNPPALSQLIESSGAQYLEITPSVLRPLVSYLAVSGTRLTPLRFVIVGGEPWPVSEYRALRAVTGPDVRIFNTYGLTEATIDSYFHETHGRYEDGDSIPIGVPFEGTEAAVLDDELRPADEGELYLTGPQLARGYLNDPVATAERFVPLPSGPPDVLWLRTGDLVRRLPDGDLVHRGRRDDVVKIRGVRLSLTEVRMTLASCPLVSAAVVACAPTRTGQELIAYVVPAGEPAQAGPEAVRRYAAARLPGAMVPSRIIVVPAIPVTSNGKADLAALSAEDSPPPVEAGEAGDAPTPEPPELTLRRIMARLLHVASIGPDDDFFDLGGDSLLAAHLVADVHSVLGVALPAAAVHEHPSAAGLTAVVANASAPATMPARPEGHEAPLAPLQRRLWLQCELSGSASVGNVAIMVRIDGHIDGRVLAGSLQYLVTRHEALRTAFVRGPDGPVQRVTASAHVQLDRVAFATRAEADAWLAREARRPFDLAAPPLLRAALVTLPAESLLLLSMHHLVSDGWSTRLLLGELGEVYIAVSAGRRPELPPVSLRYLDYARWHDAQLGAGAYAHQLSSWCARLRGSAPQPPVKRPTRHQAGLMRHQYRIGRPLAADLRSLAREHHTTPFVVLLAGLAALLHGETGQEDIIIGTPFGHRDIPGAGQTVGFFVNTAAIRIACPPGSSFADMIRGTKTAVSHARARQDVPFDVIHHHLRRSGTAVAWTSWFNYLGDDDPAPQLPGAQTRVLDPPPTAALYDVNLYLTQRDGGFTVDIVHDAAVVDVAIAQSAGRQYCRLLELAAADPRLAVPGPRPSAHYRPVASSVADIARLTPHAVAVRGTAGSLSYRQLWRWAGALSADLAAAGVRPGDLVAVHARRDPALIACLLAAWSAGASFCILDPAYPVRRLATQLASCGQVAVMLSCDPLPEQLSGAARTVLSVGEGPLDGPEGEPEPARFPGYVCWTSGTTGVPKQLSASGKPLAHFLDVYTQKFRVQPGDRFAMCSGLGHDPLLRDIFAPLRAGATVCIPPDSSLRSGRELANWLASERVTVLHCTPQLIRLLHPADVGLASLRLIMSSGDQLHAADVAWARKVAPAATVVNAYGLTETPQVMAWHAIGPGDRVDPDCRRIPVGDGIDGVKLTVCDRAGEPAGIGETGIIVIQSDYLADGLGTECRTGDLGRMLPDGQLEVTGRSDDRVKIAGFRAETGDVDAAVRSLPYIRDCHTVAVAGPAGELQLVAYAVGMPDSRVTMVRLRSDVRELLPAFLIPTGLVVMPSLPLTAAGKVDRASLPAWNQLGYDNDDSEDDGTGAASGPRPAPTAPSPPGNSMEALIAEVWQAALGRSTTPGLDANFFDLGGTSLIIASVQVQLERALGRTVPILTLFEYPTVRALARHFAAEAEPAAVPPRNARRPVAGDGRRRLLIRAGLEISDREV